MNLKFKSFSAIMFVFVLALCLVDIAKGQTEPNNVIKKSSENKVPTKPIIIWYSREWANGKTQSIEFIAKSGIFSHIILAGRHVYDAPNHINSPEFKETLKICKDNGVEVIWTRFLYPNHSLRGFNRDTVFSSDYYVSQILNLKKEAYQAGVRLIAFDTEICCDSPLLKHKEESFEEFEYIRLLNAVNEAVKIAGPVDFVFPSAAAKKNHLYNAASEIANDIITEATYYDKPIVHKRNPDPNRPYDIFGAYVGVTKENRLNPKLTLYAPREILERQDLWAHKKGLFIYPGRFEYEVAREFYKIRSVTPEK